MRIFSKFDDYNEKLEEVLDRKTFSANIKNLLLSMIYKIEIYYKDYKTVKRTPRLQNEFVKEIIETIKDNCDNIKCVEPDKKEAETLKKNKVLALTNERERTILCYPTELSLLFAISDIIPKYFYIPKDFIFNYRFQTALVNGFNYNNCEILSNFNGWSWDSNAQSQNKNFMDNLVYQNLLFISGDRFLTEWRNSSSSERNFLEELIKYMKSITGNNSYFYTLCSFLYKTANSKEHQRIELFLQEKNKELRKMQSKEKYIEDKNKRKLKCTNLVRKIDLILNDENSLKKEFVKINKKLDEDKKIKNIKTYANMLKKERELYINEIAQISFLLKPANYLKRKTELEAYSNILKNKNSIQEEMIELEKEFLIFFNKKINKVETRDEIVNIIYELRYMKYIPISKTENIKDIEILNTAIEKLIKKAITKACKIGAMRIVSMDIALNYEIISYALDTKIIELEEIKLSLEYRENSLIIKVFDKEVFEKQGKKSFENKKGLLEVRYNKMFKLFN